MLKFVESGAIHLAISAYPSDSDLQGKVLFPLGALAVVPRGHRFSQRKALEITDLVNEPLLMLKHGFMTRQLVDGACQVAHIAPGVVIESGSPHCLMALTEAGHGISILPSTVRLIDVPLPAIPLHQEGRQLGLWISAVWNPRRYLSPAAETFVEMVHAYTRREYPGKEFGFKNPIDSTTVPRG